MQYLGYAAAYKYRCVVVQSQIIICWVSHKIHQQHTNNTQSNPSFNGGWWFRQWCFCNFVDLIQKHIVTALLDIKVKLCDVFSSWMKGPFWVLSPSSWHHSLSETNWTLAKKIMDPQSNRLVRKLQAASCKKNTEPKPEPPNAIETPSSTQSMQSESLCQEQEQYVSSDQSMKTSLP